KVFKTLPAQTRELLVQSAKGITAWERAETQRREEDYLSKIRAAGVDIYKLSEQERKVFREHLAHLPDQYEAVIGPDLLAKTQELRWRAMPAEQREKELVIGLDADLSAGGALAGMAIRRGMELAITDINNQGGLLGRALRLVALDHRAVPSQGLMNIKELATQANLLAVVGGMHGFVVNEELDFIQHSEIPYLIPWAAASDLTQTDHIPNSVFRFSITDAVATPFLLNKATANGRTVGMLLERSLWGRSNEHAARHWRQEYECSSMVGIQYFNRGDEDFDTYLQKLKIQGADTIVMVANPRESIHILEAIAKQAKPMPVYAHWGLTGGDFWKSTKHMLKKVDLSFIQTLTLAPPVNERLKPLIEKYRQTYGLQPDERIMAPVGTVHAWELIHILAQAVESAKSVEHDRVRDALEKIEVYSGVTGDHKKPFTAQRHEALNADDLILTRFNDQGHIVPVGE
ncbi:ABC transporter substrate-binding protein, partial [Myxococcota bacterium]|nr:ABC transporter substrate-binding protein [Myxococcota bacterium]